MDEGTYSIRPFLDADFEAEARIVREFDPEHAPTVEELRHWDSVLRLQTDRLNLRLVVEETRSREVVGYGSLGQPHHNYHPRKYWTWIAVAPSHRHKGLGTAMFRRLEGEARQRGGIGLWSSTREADAEGVRFLEGRGFQVRNRIWMSRVDLSKQEFSAVPDRSTELAAQGVRISTLAEEGFVSPEVRRKLYRVVKAAAMDVPRIGEFQPPTFEEFLAIDVEAPGIVPEGLFLAWNHEELVGMSSLERELARPDTVHVGFTGVLPDFRGRGIATELKRRAAVLAREMGFRFLLTGNDSLNAPILKINQLFGFRPEVVFLQGEKSLVD